MTVIPIDRSTLPYGQYREIGVETRQVIDLNLSRVVTEYRAQILEDAAGKRFVAPFPAGVSKTVHYGNRQECGGGQKTLWTRRHSEALCKSDQ